MNFEYMTRGGFFMWPIALCSAAAAAIVIERFIRLRGAKCDERALTDKIDRALDSGDRETAARACEGAGGALPRVLAAGLDPAARTVKHVEKRMAQAASAEIQSMESFVGGLSTVATVAPLLGLLGTVSGMIKAFMIIEKLGGKVNATVLAGGIWEALLTTAFGLMVGIPAFIFFEYFMGIIDKHAAAMEQASQSVIDSLLEKGLIE